jgi:hypothetical protein
LVKLLTRTYRRSVSSPVGYQNQGVSLESSDFFAAAFLGYVFVYDV